MSLILDALKQADRERRITQAPESAPVLKSKPQASPRRRFGLWFCAAVLAAGVIVVLLFRPERPKQTIGMTSERPRTTTPRNSDRPAGAPGAVFSSSTVERETPPSRRIDEPLPDKKRPNPERETLSDSSGAARPVRSPIRNAVTENTSVAVSESPAPTLEKESRGKTEDVQPQGKAESEGRVDQPAAADAERALPLVSELPPEVRGSLGELEISAHVFDEDSSRRFVFINQRSYRTGDRIGENGPLLKEITPDGVVIDYGKGQARLQIGRPGLWSK